MKINSGCRACNSKNLIGAVDLGNIPVAGHFTEIVEKNVFKPETFMKVCIDCGLGQLSVDLDPSDLYVNYNWRTSTSKSYVEYAQNFADTHVARTVEDNRHKWVLEIGSNDGYLLSYLKKKQIDVLGVDPSKNISLYALAKGVPVVTEFFNLSVAKKIKEVKGSPAWIVANNVLAHTPDINSFMEGIAHLCDENTVISIENPTIMNILLDGQFETIFHEHYSYLSVSSVTRLANNHGLKVYDVEEVSPQGGSNRYLLNLSKDRSVNSSVEEKIKYEIDNGLYDENVWSLVNSKIKDNLIKFKKDINSLSESGAKITAYAASAKASTIINAAGVNSNIICIADDVKEKQGRYIPGTDIKVVSTEEMLSHNPTDIIIFASNIKTELEKKLRRRGFQGNIIVWNNL